MLIADPIVVHVVFSEPAHRRNLYCRIMQCWIAEVVLLMQKIDPQHRCQQVDGRDPSSC
jgi:hypothetical protein